MKIKICMGSACFVRGNNSNLAFIEKYAEENNISADIELIGSRCENCCSRGPLITIDEKRYEKADIDMIKQILNDLNR